MNPTERLTIWEGIVARNQEELVFAAMNYPAADAALLAKIKANIKDSIDTARGFVKYYSEKIEQAA